MPSEDTKILELNHYQKSDKALFIIHVDVECVIEKIDECKNNPENSSTTNVTEHIPSKAYNSIMCGYFFIASIDFILKG